MTLKTLTKIFEWFTTTELILARLVIFALFLIGLWTVFQWASDAHHSVEKLELQRYAETRN